MPEERKQLRRACRALFSSLVVGVRRAWRSLRAPRHLRLATPPNKRMHATADTLVVMLRQSCSAARDARRSAAVKVTGISMYYGLPLTEENSCVFGESRD